MSEDQVRGDSPLQMVGRTFVVTGAPTPQRIELKEVTPDQDRRYVLETGAEWNPLEDEIETWLAFAPAPSLPGGPVRARPQFDFTREAEAAAAGRMPPKLSTSVPQDHLVQARKVLQDCRERIAPMGAGEARWEATSREEFLSRLLAEAQVHATLAIATELERHRMAGWGRPA